MNIRFRDWERGRMKDWRFRLWSAIYWPWYQWARFRCYLARVDANNAAIQKELDEIVTIGDLLAFKERNEAYWHDG